MESAANEFFVGFSKNADPSVYESVSLKLFISTPELNPVSFTVVARGFNFSGLATSNSTTKVNLPYKFQVRSNNITERNKGIRIKAEGDNKLSVYGYNTYIATSDAFLALPCNSLALNEYEYYGITYPDGRASFSSDILIVGCENNTIVTTPSSTIVLNQFETYILSTSDSTGMRVTSTKPVAFFSNQDCVKISSSSRACDHLTEQMPPTSTWGSSFFVASFMNTTSGDIIRIIAAKNSTTINVNCTTFAQVQYLLNAGNWRELIILPQSFCNIESSAPIFIAQFAVGSTTRTMSDPFMMMIPPVEQYSNNYVFNSISGYTNYITLYVASKYYQPGRIFIDATSQINSEWTTLYCFNSSDICGYITRVSLPAGDHRVFHQDTNASVGASVYGFRSADSYGYPAGLKSTQCE